MTHTLCALLATFVLAQEPALEMLELEPLEPPMATQTPATARPLQTPAPQPTRPIAVPRFPPGTELKVDASSLGLRSAPATDGPLIYYIPRHDRVTVLQDVMDPVTMTIAGRTGLWVYVRHGNRQGYVFDAYLAPAPPPLDQLLDWAAIPGVRVGPIQRETTYAELTALIGEEHLSETEFDTGGGVTERATRVFADSDKELVIRWEIYRQTPLSVLVLGPKWRTPEGLAVGMRASSLTAINGRHFAFYGFGWDFEGQVTSWEGGTLDGSHALRDRINITLAPRRPYVDADFERLQGTTEYTSDHPKASVVNLHISSMTIQINPQPAR